MNKKKVVKKQSVSKHPASVIPAEVVENKILFIRARKVMLDSSLAEMYRVPTYRLNEQVKRNMKRFPPDFMFQLTEQEAKSLRSHFAISNSGRGGRRYLPYVFTQEGVAMLSSVLNSERAIQVNIAIMRAFVRLREILSTHKKLAKKLNELEKKYNSQFQVVFTAIRQLMKEEKKPKRPIGFHVRQV